MKLPSFKYFAIFPALSTVLCGWWSLPSQAEDASTVVKDPNHVYGEQQGILPNFHIVHPFLYRGGEPTEAGMAALKEKGVDTIIDLRGHPGNVAKEKALAAKLGMRSINLPMSSKAPTPAQIKTFISEVEKAEKSGETVFVHCAHGSDRAGCMIGIWRVTHDNYSYDDAYKEMRKYYFSPKFTELSGTVKRLANPKISKDSKETP
jgi:protein tyrosine phosphatase (PTP) superfamily phosphohydrolase (DUF442 family)